MQRVSVERTPESPARALNKARVLVAEDDPEIRAAVGRLLRDNGFGVLLAESGPEALNLVDQRVDLLILDLGLPALGGLDVLDQLRSTSQIPVLILSARAGGKERVMGLERGADDYLVKPYFPGELVARVEALLRRARLPAISTAATGPLSLDEEAHQAFLEGQPVKLSPTEYELLRVLAGTPRKTFTREELLERVWGPEQWDTRRVDLYVSKLRAKLRRPGVPVLIQSVWGVGYKFANL